MPKFGQVHFGNNYFSEDTPRGGATSFGLTELTEAGVKTDLTDANFSTSSVSFQCIYIPAN